MSRLQPIGLRATRRRQRQGPATFSVSEGTSPHRELETNPKIKIGDFIRYETNNQEGQKTYQVVASPEDGKPMLKLYSDYDSIMENLYDDFEAEAMGDEDEEMSRKRPRAYGGKRATKRRTKRTSRRARRGRRSSARTGP